MEKELKTKARREAKGLNIASGLSLTSFIFATLFKSVLVAFISFGVFTLLFKVKNQLKNVTKD